MGVLLAASVLFWLQHAVGILQIKLRKKKFKYKSCDYIKNTGDVGQYFSMFEGLQRTPLQTSGLLFICGYS